MSHVSARNLEDVRPTVALLRDAAVLAELGDVADVVRRGRVMRAVDADHHVAAVLAPRAGVAELERCGVCELFLGWIPMNNRHGEDESKATEARGRALNPGSFVAL